MNQRKYALELLAEAGLRRGKVALTPLEFNIELIVSDQDVDQASELVEDVQQYQRMIGKLLYLTNTRTDIAYTVQTRSQFMQKPTKQHQNVALKVLRYITTQPGLGLLMSSEKDIKLTGYCDADWAACPNTKRSVTGYILKLGNSLIAWKSKKQATISRSSAEAQYRSLAGLTTEVVWVNNLAKELGIKIEGPVSVYCDSKAAIQIAANPAFHERTKYIEIDCHFIREKIQQGLIKTLYVSSHDQLAGLLTKALGRTQHEYLLFKLGVLNVFMGPSLRRSIENSGVT